MSTHSHPQIIMPSHTTTHMYIHSPSSHSHPCTHCLTHTRFSQSHILTLSHSLLTLRSSQSHILTLTQSSRSSSHSHPHTHTLTPSHPSSHPHTLISSQVKAVEALFGQEGVRFSILVWSNGVSESFSSKPGDLAWQKLDTCNST